MMGWLALGLRMGTGFLRSGELWFLERPGPILAAHPFPDDGGGNSQKAYADRACVR